MCCCLMSCVCFAFGVYYVYVGVVVFCFGLLCRVVLCEFVVAFVFVCMIGFCVCGACVCLCARVECCLYCGLCFVVLLVCVRVYCFVGVLHGLLCCVGALVCVGRLC